MATYQKRRECITPKVEFPEKRRRKKPISRGAWQERMVIDPSPRNKVNLQNGILSKNYDCVGADSGKKTGEFVTVQFSAAAHFSMLMSNKNGIWKAASGIPLNWFKRDVKIAANGDAAIRAFVLANPKMRMSLGYDIAN